MAPDFRIVIRGDVAEHPNTSRLQTMANEAARDRGGTTAEFVEKKQYEQSGHEQHEYLYAVVGRK